MQSTAVRLLIAAAMFLLALLFTGMLAAWLEQRAEDRQPVDETYTPPKVPKF